MSLLLHHCWDGIGIWNCLCYITVAGIGNSKCLCNITTGIVNLFALCATHDRHIGNCIICEDSLRLMNAVSVGVCVTSVACAALVGCVWPLLVRAPLRSSGLLSSIAMYCWWPRWMLAFAHQTMWQHLWGGTKASNNWIKGHYLKTCTPKNSN